MHFIYDIILIIKIYSMTITITVNRTDQFVTHDHIRGGHYGIYDRTSGKEI